MDLENLDQEKVDLEMVTDEASQSATSAPVGDVPKDAHLPPPVDDDAAAT